jgi:hypothetical protein
MASINSRALLESPAGAGAFIVTVAMRFSPCRTGLSRPYRHRGLELAAAQSQIQAFAGSLPLREV